MIMQVCYDLCQKIVWCDRAARNPLPKLIAV